MKRKLQNHPRTSTIDGLKTWQLLREGDQQVLSDIFLSQYTYLFYYGMRINPDEEMVKDCIQNLFERLWHKRESLRDIRTIKPYLKVSLRHLIIDERNQNLKRVRAHSTYSSSYAFTNSHEAFIIAEQQEIEQTNQLKRAINTLPKRQQEAMHLRTYEELDYANISERMSLNVQSVRNLIHQSIKTLKKCRVSY